MPKFVEPLERLPFSVLGILPKQSYYAENACERLVIPYFKGHKQSIE
jgi:hypothetical protein